MTNIKTHNFCDYVGHVEKLTCLLDDERRFPYRAGVVNPFNIPERTGLRNILERADLRT